MKWAGALRRREGKGGRQVHSRERINKKWRTGTLQMEGGGGGRRRHEFYGRLGETEGGGPGPGAGGKKKEEKEEAEKDRYTAEGKEKDSIQRRQGGGREEDSCTVEGLEKRKAIVVSGGRGGEGGRETNLTITRNKKSTEL